MVKSISFSKFCYSLGLAGKHTSIIVRELSPSSSHSYSGINKRDRDNEHATTAGLHVLFTKALAILEPEEYVYMNMMHLCKV